MPVLGPYGPMHISFPGPIMIFIKAFKMVISKINEDQERIMGLILSCEDRAFHWYLI